MSNSSSSNRLNMPTVARVIDDIRDVFGADARVLYAKENGFELGKPPDAKGVFSPPRRLVPAPNAASPLVIQGSQRSHAQSRKGGIQSTKAKAQDQKARQLDRLLESGQLRLGG